jgi:hypothetical protein
MHDVDQSFLRMRYSPRWAKQLALAVMAASTLTLVACGGGGSDSNTATPGNAASSPPPTMQSISTDEATSVSVVDSSLGATSTTTTGITSTTATTSTTAGTSTMQVMRTAALDFDAKVNEGPSKDTQLKGKLALNAKSTDGGKNFEVTGKLIQRDGMNDDGPGLSDENKAKLKVALKKYYDGAKIDYEKFRLGVSTLTQATDALLKVQRKAWAAVPSNAPDAPAQYAAIDAKVKTILDEFKKQLDVLQASLSKDLKALSDTLQADLQTIKPGTSKPDVPVTGTLTADGKISLTFDLGTGAKIVGVGQSDAKGIYTGTFTGPATGDKGTWTAKPILCEEPVPPTVPGTTTTVPAPTPTGTVTGTITGTVTTTVTGTVTTPVPTTTVPGTTPGGTVTLPNPGPDNCSGRIQIGAEISEIVSTSVFKVGKSITIGQYVNGIPFDSMGAKFVGGSAADIVVGRSVQVCSDDVISGITASSPPPLKASTIIFK